MTIRPIDVPGLPADIEVRRSTRRKRSVGAHREAGITIVVVPERMSVREAAKHALALHQRLLKRAQKTRVSDDQLLERASWLRKRYMPTAPAPSSIRWSTNQNRRWGSCTTTDGSIRLSARLQGMPQYVVDYVILHELAHLVVPNHGPDFNHLLDTYSQRQRACSFLDGVEFATSNPE
ncbi:MAG TPA: metal-dependent hydrolase [Actinobacteria bacterium]|nr:metal-dependent hydrolase [Actinomycetota bacterium]